MPSEADLAPAGRAVAHTPASLPRMAYLLSQYPAVSHTFFLHEVLGLRALGLDIETASINPPDRPLAHLPALEAAEAQRTLYVKSGSKPQLLARVVQAIFASPAALLRGLQTVFTMRGLTLGKRLLWLFYLAEAMLLGHWMRQRNLAHLHVHFGGPVASVGMLTARAWRMPFSLTIHGPEELLNHEACHLREKLEAADFVIAISDFCRSQLCQLTPPSMWSKFKVVRLGVDPAALTAARTPAEPVPCTPARILQLVSTGRLAPQKGHRILLEALLILRDRGRRLDATIIGGGAEFDALRAWISQHGLDDCIHLAGPLAHAETLARVRRADLFALASFAEGIPVALMEAMALGVPCVSTSVAGIPELIANGVDGLLVPPANANALADALDTLIGNAPLRSQLSHAARARITKTYNLPQNQVTLAALFAGELTRTRPQSGERRTA